MKNGGQVKKPKNKIKHKRNKSPRRGYIIVNWGKQRHTRTMGMSRKPQNISVIVGFTRILPHLMVPSYHHTSVTFPVGDLFLLLCFNIFLPFPIVCVQPYFRTSHIYIYIYIYITAPCWLFHALCGCST